MCVCVCVVYETRSVTPFRSHDCDSTHVNLWTDSYCRRLATSQTGKGCVSEGRILKERLLATQQLAS